jgi:hypothetical protein
MMWYECGLETCLHFLYKLPLYYIGSKYGDGLENVWLNLSDFSYAEFVPE